MAKTRAEKYTAPVSPFTDAAKMEDNQTGPATGGQSGDTQGLSGIAEATSESVRELAEEGQYFEAAVISGIENAPDADASEVRTREVPEDDVPLEYLESNLDEPPRPATRNPD